jgi:hypothetical protein
MSFGKGGGTTITTAQLSPEQRTQIQAQTDFFTNTIKPTYEQAVKGAGDIYSGVVPGTTAAAQNASAIAGQAQDVLGSTGESALRTGISGLENLFGADYEQQQLQAAMAPGEAQYQQNLADLGAQFGGAGQIGSSRQALAQQQLAGSTAARQQATAAGVLKDISGQRLTAGQNLATLGQSNLTGAQAAAGSRVGYSQIPQDVYNKYASVIFGTPSSSYNPNFAGTQGSTTSKNTFDMGIKI